MAEFSMADEDPAQNKVYVFTSNRGSLPGGLFQTRVLAEDWILLNKLSGLLSEYPINTGVYDWVLATGRMRKMKPANCTPDVIGGFCSHLDHWHYEDGVALT